MCFFFCLSSMFWVVKMFQLIFKISIFSHIKFNLVGTLRRSKLKIPSIPKKRQEKEKKSVKFYGKQFSKKWFLFFGMPK